MVKAVLVTVGSTKFEKLVDVMVSYDMLQELLRQGYDQVTVQFGRGRPPVVSAKHENESSQTGGIRVESYDFKPTLAEDMRSAALIISHAGAGSVMEALRAKKPLVVVVNEDLMDNHQAELAEQMQLDGHSYAATCRTLLEILRTADFTARKFLEPANTRKVADVLIEEINSVSFS